METIYFPGCTAAYRQQDTARASVKILRAGGIEFDVLGERELCCGSVLFNSGFFDEGVEIAKKNLEMFKELGIKKIITACAGCTKTFKETYAHLFAEEGLPYEVKNITEVVDELIQEGKLKFKENGEKIRVTYHDPCHLGRSLGTYEPARRILRAIPGIEFVEMKRNRENSRCCGAGGGVRSAYPETAISLAKRRIADAEEVGAELIVTPCPFCVLNLGDGAKQKGSNVKVKDITVFIAERLKED